MEKARRKRDETNTKESIRRRNVKSERQEINNVKLHKN
jgi:hypothetical protein